MTPFVVACPDCSTQFRVAAAQLAPARGLVRCGACLTVFRAETARIDGPKQTAPARKHAERHRSVLPADAPASLIAEPAREASERTGALPARELAALEEQDVRAAPRLEALSLPIEAQRVEAALDAQERVRAARRRRAPWALAALLLLLVLAAEVVWLRFDAFAQAPTTRPLAQRICDELDCTLPMRRAPYAIRSQRLLVRSHPSRDDGLRVDAVIVNRAEFPQPFPVLELRFSDIDGDLVAARYFEPSTYLAGELAGRREMPVGAPVQLSLELVDPGARAVNYEMRLH